MLVLTRKPKQQIQIGPNITITILQVKGQSVRVGIEAPKNVCVLRTELAEKMADESADPTVAAALEKAGTSSLLENPNTDCTFSVVSGVPEIPEFFALAIIIIS